MQPPVAVVGGVQDVLGDGGQVDRFVDGESALVAGQDEQGVDQPFGVVDGVAHVLAHAVQLAGCRGGLGEHDIEGGAHDGQRGA